MVPTWHLCDNWEHIGTHFPTWNECSQAEEHGNSHMGWHVPTWKTHVAHLHMMNVPTWKVCPHVPMLGLGCVPTWDHLT
jgi:hypothetical protein